MKKKKDGGRENTKKEFNIKKQNDFTRFFLIKE